MSEWRREFERAQAADFWLCLGPGTLPQRRARAASGIMSGLTSRRVCSCNGRRSAGAGVKIICELEEASFRRGLRPPNWRFDKATIKSPTARTPQGSEFPVVFRRSDHRAVPVTAQQENASMKPIGLTDRQLLTIRRAAAPLHPQDRGRYLEKVAETSNGHEIGDGLVGRVAREAQREFLRAPELEPKRAPSRVGS